MLTNGELGYGDSFQESERWTLNRHGHAHPVLAKGMRSLGDVVDFHTHFFPAQLPVLSDRTGDDRWPHLEVRSADAGDIMCGSARFRRVARPCWDVAARLASMDGDGVSTQIMSPVPISLTYWAEPRLADEFARIHNDLLAEAVAASGGRILALATVPLQDVDLAVAELCRAIDDLDMVGVEIGTRIGERELSDPILWPFFAEAARRRLPLFVHPVDAAGAVPRCRGPVAGFGLGMLTDTAIAVHELIYGGVLEAFPGLRICLSHGGGGYPWSHARLRYGAGLAAGDQRAVRYRELDDLARILWADALVFDPTQLAVSAAVFGADHLLLGSDYPFVDFSSAVAAARTQPGGAYQGVEGSNAARFLFG